MKRDALWRGMLALTVAVSVHADDRILNSKHDLSAAGPGPVRARVETEVCIFCHAPHNTSPAAPLWNRHNPRAYYRVYSSSTTDARIDQPTGDSKLCLSCHDGTIAPGLVLNRPQPIPMSHPILPTGRANLTNDLSDDHPIGLRYDRQLTNRDRQLREPASVDRRIHLGGRGELECTACHDPHNNEFGDFLRVPLRDGALCNACHQMDGWRESAHATSPRPVPISLRPDAPLPFPTMAENACASCHASHGATQRERLLYRRSYELCLECHNGITARDVQSVNGLRSGHRPSRFIDGHDPAEDPRLMPPHVDCVDCHNPHAVQPNILSLSTRAAAELGPLHMPTMREVPGVSLTGVTLDRAENYYEVCFRCHADRPVPTRDRIIRQRDDGGNIRRQLQPNVASAHPITFPARNRDENPSLLPEYRSRSYISCQDCHNNPDARQLGGGSANGPHGSRFANLLVARYDTADFTIESAQSYALCYSCHDRNSILGDESFAGHRRHVVDARTPCSACHAPHGVNGDSLRHSHLINFDLSIVSGQREFIDRGRFAGSCTLTCHGVRHVNLSYGP